MGRYPVNPQMGDVLLIWVAQLFHQVSRVGMEL